MKFSFEEQDDNRFCWSIARRNTMAAARYATIAITSAVLFIEISSFSQRDTMWFVEHFLYMPISLFALCWMMFLPLQRADWWWRKRWATERRRKYLTAATVVVCIYLPLLHSSVWNYLFNGPNETSAVLTLALYSFFGYFPGAIVGIPLAWLLLSLAGGLRGHVGVAARIYRFFWPEKHDC